MTNGADFYLEKNHTMSFKLPAEKDFEVSTQRPIIA